MTSLHRFAPWMLLLASAACGGEQKPATTAAANPEQGARPAQPSDPTPAAPASPQPASTYDLGKVGTVVFPTSCSPKVQNDFQRAVAVLHSFFYPEARRLFTEIAKADPNCAMAQWGIAMTLYHPIWTPPTDQDIAEGRAALALTEKMTASPREKDYLAALNAFYTATDKPPTGPGGEGCHGPTAAGTNRPVVYTEAMQKLAAKYPDDDEAQAFYALALLGSAPPTDATQANQLKAAEILEALWKRNKDHPGAAHYLIHAYDSPQFATRALAQAQHYAEIAPRVAHATHMPTHIFTRLGMWKDSVAGNLISAKAADDYAAVQKKEGLSAEALHAYDYLVYAYLQTGDDDKAKEIVDKVAAAEKAFPDTEMALAYAFGAIPARYALERKQWKDAGAIPVKTTKYFERFPFGEALIEYAHAVGRAKSGDLAGAREASKRLAELRDAVKDPRFGFFKKQVDVQHQIAEAMIAAGEHKRDAAVKELRAAAAIEDEMGKNPVSPGALLPARDLVADLLLEMNKPGEALTEYETSLRIRPSRFYSLAGAAAAAEKANKKAIARKYYKELQELASSRATRPELEAAKKLATN